MSAAGPRQIEQAAKRLLNGDHDFSEGELQVAAAVVAEQGYPLRDSIVIREARRRRAELTDRATDAWELIRKALAKTVPPNTFKVWVEPMVVAGERDGTLVVEAAGHVTGWVRRRYLPRMRELTIELTDYPDIEIRQRRKP